MATKSGLSAACLLIAFGLVPAMAGGGQGGARIVVAEYMRAVPAGPTDAHHCARICVKARDMGGKAEPVCVQWQKVC